MPSMAVLFATTRVGPDARLRRRELRDPARGGRPQGRALIWPSVRGLVAHHRAPAHADGRLRARRSGAEKRREYSPFRTTRARFRRWALTLAMSAQKKGLVTRSERVPTPCAR